jgi:hypothetical protein
MGVDQEPTRWLVIDERKAEVGSEESRALANREQTLSDHSEVARNIAHRLAKSLGLPTDYIELLALAARLHDEGKDFWCWQRAFNAPRGAVYAKTVLEFLAEAEPRRFVPKGYVEEAPEKGDNGDDSAEGCESKPDGISEASATFPAAKGDRMALPIRFGGGNRPIVELGHWADGSDRNSFKLYAGNRSAEGIARAMLLGVALAPRISRRKRASQRSGCGMSRSLLPSRSLVRC